MQKRTHKQTLNLAGGPHAPLTALDSTGAETAPPSRIRLLAWGENPSTKGMFKVGSGTLAALTANQKRYGFDRVALDFQHNTVPGTQAYKESQEPRPVAAFGVPQVVGGEGLFLTDLAWTPEGEANWRNYRDVSATVAQDAAGEVTFLHSAAVCRQGAVPGMELEAASVEVEEKPGTEAGGPGDTPAGMPGLLALDAESMAAVVEAVGTKLRDAEWYKREAEETRAALEKANQTNAALNTALESLAAQVAALKAQLEAAQAAAAPVAALTALSADVASVKAAQAAAAEKAERDLLLLTARAQGKLIPLSAEGLAAAPLATLRDLVAQAKPGQVPVGRLTALQVDPGPMGGQTSPREKAEADRIFRRAQELSATHPAWQWSRCWAQAQAGLS